LTEKIKRFRAGLIKFEPSFKREAGELYALLLKNLEPEIGNAKNLVIIPDGVLVGLPFKALITRKQKYLIEKHAVPTRRR
jgi:CHAT domain-containing protein